MTNSEEYLDENGCSIDYSIFELSDHLGRKNTLPALASFLVEKLGIFSSMKIDPTMFFNFFVKI
jgi:hypothetical protein